MWRELIVVYSYLKGRCKDSEARLLSVVADSVKEGQKPELGTLVCCGWLLGRTCSPGGWCSPGGMDLGPWERVVV